MGGVRARREVSIHAPAREATRFRILPSSGSLFQSTPPHGRRRVAGEIKMLTGVSIHAPAREAT